MSNAQLNELNDLVKNSENVKVIVLADGTVQAVDINATNVKDDLPDAEPYAEVKGNKVQVGVQQRESTVIDEVKAVKPKRTPRKTEKVVEPVKVDDKVTKTEKVVEPVKVDDKVTKTESTDNSTKETPTEDSVTEVTDK